MGELNITLLGSTGSIGRSTLDVLEGLQVRGVEVRVAALTARTSVVRLAEQARRWQPELAVIADPSLRGELEGALERGASRTRVATGMEGLVEAAVHPEADQVVNALVGGVGLVPTVRALERKKRVALANKETLVVGGGLVTRLAGRAVRDRDSLLLPVDSEHSALLQALGEHPDEEVERLVLTASGGPFRDTPVEAF
ncbi:MAG: 1-deoxy-D-xylulose-5-phosphate reductoisomerase, partial [bacterium]